MRRDGVERFMKEKLKQIGEKIKSFWGGLSKVVRIIVVSVGAAVIIGAVVLTILLNTSSNGWIVLFPDMSREESTAVYLELQNMGVETQLTSSGEIQVREEEWDSLVYELAELGYPESTPSYGTFFDNLSMTMTEFEKQQTLRFELQNRLQTTIKRIDGVRGAIVTISVPESSGYVWKENDDTATASVMLTLQDPEEFSSDSVGAIKKLVAYSAQQMTPDDVTVIDASSGVELLTTEQVEALKPEGEGINTDQRVYYENIVKNQYEANAEKILTPIFGDVTAVAAVTVDYDKITEECKELLTNEDGEGVKENEHVGFDTGLLVGDGGVVGEEPNTDIPNYVNDEDVINSDNSTYYERDTEWAIGYILTQTEKAQGVVKDASIAVVVTTDDGYLTSEKREEIAQLVKNATNLPLEKVSVSARSPLGNISDPVIGDPANGLTVKQLLLILIPMAFLFLLILILLVFLVTRRSKKKMQEQLAAQQEQNQETINELQQTLEETKRSTLEEAAKQRGEENNANANEIREFAKNNPELTAALIRSLMKEDD